MLVGLLPLLNACGQSQKNSGTTSRYRSGAYSTFNHQMQEMNVAFRQDSSNFSHPARQTYHKMQNLWAEMLAGHGAKMQGRGNMMGARGKMMGNGMMGSRSRMTGNSTRAGGMGKQMISYLVQMRQMMDQAGNPTMASMFGEMQNQFQKAQPGSSAISDSTSATANKSVAAINGKQLFDNSCGTCHGANGNGMGGAFPPINGSPIVSGSKETLIKIVLKGLQGPVGVNGTQYNSMMPSFGETYTNAQLAAILTYMRAMPKNRAGRITPDDIHQVREATASHSEAWTAKELGLK